MSWVDSKQNDKLLDVKLELPSQCTVQDCIVFAIKGINANLKNENYHYSLKENYNLYSMFVSKKNGYPKTDYPGILKIKIITTIFFVFSFRLRSKTK